MSWLSPCPAEPGFILFENTRAGVLNKISLNWTKTIEKHD